MWYESEAIGLQFPVREACVIFHLLEDPCEIVNWSYWPGYSCSYFSPLLLLSRRIPLPSEFSNLTAMSARCCIRGRSSSSPPGHLYDCGQWREHVDGKRRFSLCMEDDDGRRGPPR